jgi:hypothetical protein
MEDKRVSGLTESLHIGFWVKIGDFVGGFGDIPQLYCWQWCIYAIITPFLAFTKADSIDRSISVTF